MTGLVVVNMKRVFTYNGIQLADPDPGMSPDDVREFYSMQYPELSVAATEGPDIKGGTMKFQFLRVSGSKGRKPKSIASVAIGNAQKVLDAAIEGSAIVSPLEIPSNLPSKLQQLHGKFGGLVFGAESNAHYSTHPEPVRLLPSEAFGIWG